MEMKMAIRVDVVQVLAITQCLQQEDQEARLAGPAACLRDRGLPLDWPILLRSHPEIWAGAPLVLWVPARIGDRPRGTPPADCDLTTAEVLMIMQALWNWGGPPAVCRLWNLVYAALAWGVAQELADQGRCIDLATIAGRTAFSRLMEQQLRLHGAAKMTAPAEPVPKQRTAAPGLGNYGHCGTGRKEALREESGGRTPDAVTVRVSGSVVRIVLAGSPAACVVSDYAG